MSRAIVIDPLQCDLLHLTDRASLFHDYFPFVNFTDDQGCSRDPGACVGENDLTSVSYGLLPASERNCSLITGQHSKSCVVNSPTGGASGGGRTTFTVKADQVVLLAHNWV